MAFELTFHALMATLHQHQFEIARRLLDNPRDIALHAEIPNGALLKQWLSHDDDDEIFDELDSLGFLDREAGPGSYDYHIHALKLHYPTLREQLAREPFSNSVNERWLVGCFIRYAVSMDRYNVLGNVRLAGLPIHKDWFPVPSYYVEAISELSAADYCRFETGRAKWLPGVSAIMEARGYWIDGRTADEMRKAALIEIWRSMPNEIRKVVLVDHDYPAPMVLAYVMGHFWNEDTGWKFDPDFLASETEITLQGGHLPNAIEISKMVKSGLLM